MPGILAISSSRRRAGGVSKGKSACATSFADRRWADSRENRNSIESRTSGRHLRYSSGTSTSTDRKSTRLNSSHLGISYAVFCLKKKEFVEDIGEGWMDVDIACGTGVVEYL